MKYLTLQCNILKHTFTRIYTNNFLLPALILTTCLHVYTVSGVVDFLRQTCPAAQTMYIFPKQMRTGDGFQSIKPFVQTQSDRAFTLTCVVANKAVTSVQHEMHWFVVPVVAAALLYPVILWDGPTLVLIPHTCDIFSKAKVNL